MKRYIKFIILLTKMKLTRMMAFRFDFFGGFIVDGTLLIVQLLMFQAIYSQVDTIGNWGQGEMLIFVGTFAVINAINMSTFFFGTYDIPRKVLDGEFDHYLTKPMNPLLRLTFENVNPGSSPLIVVSALVVVYGCTKLNAPVSALAIVLYILFVLLMTLLWYDVSIILRTVPFFIQSVSGIMQIEDMLLPMSMKLPGIVFEGVFKIIFMLLVPYGLMATIPTQVLTSALTPLGFLYSLAVILCFTAFMLWFWKRGIRNYKSASS